MLDTKKQGLHLRANLKRTNDQQRIAEGQANVSLARIFATATVLYSPSSAPKPD